MNSSGEWIRCGFEVSHIHRPHAKFPFAQAADVLAQSAHFGCFSWTVLGTEGKERLFIRDIWNTWAALYDMRTGERLHQTRKGKSPTSNSFHCFPSLNVVLHITKCVKADHSMHPNEHRHVHI